MKAFLWKSVYKNRNADSDTTKLFRTDNTNITKKGITDMLSIIIGLLAGIGIPMQTSVNTKLRKKVGSPYYVSLISFLIALIFLAALSLLSGESLHIPLSRLFGEPIWIWGGGICGVFLLAGNILLFAHLGGIQTVVFPVVGQILAGLLIDAFGFFYAEITPLSVLRVGGALMVVFGVVLTALGNQNRRYSENTKKKGDHRLSGRNTVWLWQLFGVVMGMFCSIQIGINGYLGKVVSSSLQASVISFSVGTICIAVVCSILYRKNRKEKAVAPVPEAERKSAETMRKHRWTPWWMWTGGLLGACYNLANIYLSHRIGTGMTVILLLIGTTTGGILVDHFGLLESPKKPVNLIKISGIVIMICGAAVIKLF